MHSQSPYSSSVQLVTKRSMAPRESSRPKHRDRPTHDGRRSSRNPHRSSRTAGTPSSHTSSQALSADSLAKLNLLNERAFRENEVTPKRARPKRQREEFDEKLVVERTRRHHRKRRRRVVSGALLEEGEGRRLRRDDIFEPSPDLSKRKKRICKRLESST